MSLEVAGGLTKTSATPQYQPGQLLERDGGAKVYRYVKNKQGSALAIGDAVCFDMTTNNVDYEVKTPATATLDRLAGISMAAPASDEWFWIQVRGVGTAKIDGTTPVAAGDSLKAGNASNKLVQDNATGTAASYKRTVYALDAVTTDTSDDVYVDCL